MKSAIVVFPGTNREMDAAAAIEQASGRKPVFVWHGDTDIPDVDLIMIPGGFSYGDYLRCGAMAAHSPIMRTIKERAAKGVAIVGVCNGFQILTEAGLLPGALLRNAGLKFICKRTNLRVERDDTMFTQGYRTGQVVEVAVAHNEGNYFADEDTLDRLEGDGRVVFRYCDASGNVTDKTNLNGSRRNIAGILDDKKRILGMMPHPENAIDPLLGKTDGCGLFNGIVEALA